MSEEQTPGKGDIRWTESGEIVIFDGQDWHPIRQLPAGGPVIFRQAKEDALGDGDDPDGADASTPEADA
ncbi:MAG TPA: hypothetical protein VE465_20245 [Streptosporangiaceae bacterium]|nr:hypothetical protein [Streptosporangiaceae bacterium]